jgi:hypothetical protein
MDTDGGGWTLIASSTAVLSDEAAAHHAQLATLEPTAGRPGVWDGMRPVVADAGGADLRFTCKRDPTDPDFEVDLSFYDVGWYAEITRGTEADSCFLDGGVNVSPRRRNNLSGNVLAQGNPYNSGVLEGEDSCGSPTDFTVDFDDRGMDSNQSDGTDWGEDDGSDKCGVSGVNSGAWYMFVREL